MIATIRALTGRAPRRYFGDSADPSRPRVRDLKEEALRVFRSRVVNPKWLASIRRHGYKGGLEMATTVDYLFGYDATSDVLEDWMYERLVDAYLKDEEVLRFLEKSNPWALRDIAERLLEAISRGLWMDPNEETLWVLKSIIRRSLPAMRVATRRTAPQPEPVDAPDKLGAPSDNDPEDTTEDQPRTVEGRP
jgi:cobaltochelatase CobN